MRYPFGCGMALFRPWGRRSNTRYADLYSQDHQYVIVEDGVGTVGITNYAQEKLSEVTTVELPHVGAQVQKGVAVGVGRVRQGCKRPLFSGKRRNSWCK